MNAQDMERLVTEIIARLAPRLGADGSKGSLIAVVSAATVALEDAVQQLRNLVLAGFQIQLLFSRAAESLLGAAVRDQLQGFPHIGELEARNWLEALQQARAVVVPLLSVNTLAKLTLLVADTPIGNVLLHALFMGKPVVMAIDGVDPQGPGRSRLGFHQGRPALLHALQKRIQTATDYGCRFVRAPQLAATLQETLADPSELASAPSKHPVDNERFLAARGRVISVSQVAHAHRQGKDLQIAVDAVITPLAREWAASHGVRLLRSEQ